MRRFLTIAASVALSFAAFSSCSNDPSLNGALSVTGSTIRFLQIDRVGNAGLAEVFSPYSRHDASNRSSPQGDKSAMNTDINAFVTGGFGGRSAATSTFVQNLLAPDALLADLSQTGNAQYLGVQTSGQFSDYCTGSRVNGKFGGRALQDDVVDTTFQFVFGNYVALYSAGSSIPNTSGAIADDGNEKDGRAGRPTLTTDNVGCAGKHFNLTAFPYLGDPR
ncbi:MAG: DUF4331 family protein [Candidatus Eremiobacteraeota bacterium]|nr:DUF4331 family protein [Candidatus Eremiobacteraeota bacterium]